MSRVLVVVVLSEVYCNIVLITGSCRQCCIHRHRVTGFMLLCVRGLQHHRVTGFMLIVVCKRFTASSCYGVHVIGLQHHRVTEFMLFLLC